MCDFCKISVVLFLTYVADPEPVYAKTYGVVTHKGKKKKAARIDLNPNPSTDASPGNVMVPEHKLGLHLS